MSTQCANFVTQLGNYSCTNCIISSCPVQSNEGVTRQQNPSTCRRCVVSASRPCSRRQAPESHRAWLLSHASSQEQSDGTAASRRRSGSALQTGAEEAMAGQRFAAWPGQARSFRDWRGRGGIRAQAQSCNPTLVPWRCQSLGMSCMPRSLHCPHSGAYSREFLSHTAGWNPAAAHAHAAL